MKVRELHFWKNWKNEPWRKQNTNRYAYRNAKPCPNTSHHPDHSIFSRALLIILFPLWEMEAIPSFAKCCILLRQKNDSCQKTGQSTHTYLGPYFLCIISRIYYKYTCVSFNSGEKTNELLLVLDSHLPKGLQRRHVTTPFVDLEWLHDHDSVDTS